MASDLIGWFASAGTPLLLLGALLLGFGESAALLDVIVPGEVGMVLVGAAAADAKLPLAPFIACAVAGAILGDLVGFTIGRRWGASVVYRWDFTTRVIGPRLERAESWFDDHGGPTVFVSRWVGALRAVMPLVAGTADMSYGRYLLWNVPAASMWAMLVVSLGYVFGAPVANLVDSFGLWVSIGAFGAIALALVVRWLLHRRGSGASSDHDDDHDSQSSDSHRKESNTASFIGTPVDPKGRQADRRPR